MEKRILGLCELGVFIQQFIDKNQENYDDLDNELYRLMLKSQIENSWFTLENQKFALQHWANIMKKPLLEGWLAQYSFDNDKKRVGLILAGNLPLVGLHDVISVVLSGHTALVKLSSKDQRLLPFLLHLWNRYSGESLLYEFVEKLTHYDAVIATGSNNTARYLEQYFKDKSSVIRKSRTSIAVLSGNESEEELKFLAEDIFRYFGLGCRNVTRLFVPENFILDRLFESFTDFKEVINHNQYANNYDYNRAIYLLNQEKFWDNNFVLLKEDDALFSPLAVLNFSRYKSLDEVDQFIEKYQDEIQCVVSQINLKTPTVKFGNAQYPSWNTYADNVDILLFLAHLK